jgi:hypothetical protein
MVFDLPFFVSSLPTRPILRVVSVPNVSLSATTKGGSKTSPYFGMANSPHKMHAVQHHFQI